MDDPSEPTPSELLNMEIRQRSKISNFEVKLAMQDLLIRDLDCELESKALEKNLKEVKISDDFKQLNSTTRNVMKSSTVGNLNKEDKTESLSAKLNERPNRLGACS